MGFGVHHGAFTTSGRRGATLVAVLGLLVGCALGLLLGGAVGVSKSSAASSEQTRPVVHPRRGHAQTTFTLSLTPQHDLGANGAIRSEYRVLITGPQSACNQSSEITQGTRAHRVRELLKPPASGGWCVGRYRGQVLYQQGPFCPPPVVAGTVCPLIASEQVDAGHFSFRVLSPRRPPPHHHHRHHHRHHR